MRAVVRRTRSNDRVLLHLSVLVICQAERGELAGRERHRLIDRDDRVDIDGVPEEELNLGHELVHRVGVRSIGEKVEDVPWSVYPPSLNGYSEPFCRGVDFGARFASHRANFRVNRRAGIRTVGKSHHV
jgi:hypothetical protein